MFSQRIICLGISSKRPVEMYEENARAGDASGRAIAQPLVIERPASPPGQLDGSTCPSESSNDGPAAVPKLVGDFQTTLRKPAWIISLR